MNTRPDINVSGGRSHIAATLVFRRMDNYLFEKAQDCIWVTCEEMAADLKLDKEKYCSQICWRIKEMLNKGELCLRFKDDSCGKVVIYKEINHESLGKFKIKMRIPNRPCLCKHCECCTG